MVTIVDDRTEEQMLTHRLAVVGTDSFMSGWGGAEGGMSYAAWAFKDGQESACLATISNRGDMKRVRVVNLDGYQAKGAAHCHIYVWRGQLQTVRT
jgi:hypothetical protein